MSLFKPKPPNGTIKITVFPNGNITVEADHLPDDETVLLKLLIRAASAVSQSADEAKRRIIQPPTDKPLLLA